MHLSKRLFLFISLLAIFFMVSAGLVLASANSNFTLQIKPAPQCYDGVDNDLDGLIDYPADPGCTSTVDDNEIDPQCMDGIDNDMDSLIDFPADPGCTSTSDDSEGEYQCQDGVDNDMDGLIDFPDDPDCVSITDDNESKDTTGGSGGITIISVTSILFVGKAYPLASITILQDGQQVAVTTADSQGNFRQGLTDLTPGDYSFSLFGSDPQGNYTNSYSFRVKINKGAIIQVSDIFLSPTIKIDKTEIVLGEIVTFSGLTVPNGEVRIDVSSPPDNVFLKTTAGSNGAWVYNFNTSNLKFGKHKATVTVVLGKLVSDKSRLVEFQVKKEKEKVEPSGPSSSSRCGKADLNCDGRVNLVDFSIAAYWYKRPFNSIFKEREIEVLNGDAKIDLVDFSIMAYYWTG